MKAVNFGRFSILTWKLPRESNHSFVYIHKTTKTAQAMSAGVSNAFYDVVALLVAKEAVKDRSRATTK